MLNNRKRERGERALLYVGRGNEYAEAALTSSQSYCTSFTQLIEFIVIILDRAPIKHEK